MDALYPRCAGLDVHKDTVVAAVRLAGEAGATSEVRSFDTTTPGLLALSAWLAEAGCTHVAMEATGVYWKPRAIAYDGNAGPSAQKGRIHMETERRREAAMLSCFSPSLRLHVQFSSLLTEAAPNAIAPPDRQGNRLNGAIAPAVGR